MTIALEGMAVEMPEVKGHPNRAAFRGVLTVVDEPSTRAPSGSKGKRVLLTRRAAEAAIPSLLGMAVDYSPSLDCHDMRRKVGIITRAEVVERNLEVGGYLYAKDFPEIVRDIARLGRRPVGSARGASRVGIQASSGALAREGRKLGTSLMAAVNQIRRLVRSGTGKKSADLVLRAETSLALAATEAGTKDVGLGMSFEVTKVNVLNKDARIWKLIGVTFTGAAILRKDKAAYEDTWIELE